jgi:hypothetical protein
MTFDQTPNRVTSAFSAIVRGKVTGLAGCGSDNCHRRSSCLRADPMLDQRWAPEPKGCRFWIAGSGLERDKARHYF